MLDRKDKRFLTTLVATPVTLWALWLVAAIVRWIVTSSYPVPADTEDVVWTLIGLLPSLLAAFLWTLVWRLRPSSQPPV